MSVQERWYNRKANDFYTWGEEITNSITHGLGALLSLVGLILLLLLAARYGTVWHGVGFTLFGASLTLLYLASTLYHSIQSRSIRRFLWILDHSAIFLLIAGTYTPFLLIALRGVLGWSYMGIVWGLAVLGILYKIFFIGRFRFLSIMSYVLMGSISLLAFNELLATVPPQSVGWLGFGAIFYLLGVPFYVLDRMPHNHAIWHLFVLGGSFCHFLAVRTLVG